VTRTFLAGAVVAGLFATAIPAAAPPIQSNDYALEYTQGPVFASNRVVGLRRRRATRPRYTLGACVQLFEWSVFGLVPHTSWTISSSGDLASRGYFDWGLSIGTWD